MSENEDAIQQDVSPTPNPRDEIIAELAKNAQDKRDDEFREEGIDPASTGIIEDDNGDSPIEGTIEEDNDLEKDEVENKDSDTDPDVKTRTLKVDGKEVEFDEDKIYDAGVRALQKESTADLRLEEATTLLREAKEQTNKLNSQPSSPDVETTELPKNEARDIVKAIQYGDEDVATEAVQKVFGRNKATQDMKGMSSVEIGQVVNDQLAFNGALEMMNESPENGGYSDVFTDPQLSQMVATKEAELLKENPNTPYRERFAAAGDFVRSWRNDLTGVPAEKVTDIDARKQRKASAESTTASASGTKVIEKEAPKRLTTNDVIEDMRLSR